MLLLLFTDDYVRASFLVGPASVGVVQGDKVGLHKGEEGGALACDSELTPFCDFAGWFMDRFIGCIIKTNSRGMMCLCFPHCCKQFIAWQL